MISMVREQGPTNKPPTSKLSGDELLTQALGETAECPSIETLAEVASSMVDTAETLRVRTHAASCPRCDAELLLADAFYEESGAAETYAEQIDKVVAAQAPIAPAATNHRAWAGWLVAAALLIGMAVLPIVRSSGVQSLPTPVEDTVRRGNTIVAIAPQGRVAEAPQELRWRARPEAVRYRVDLRRVDRSVIWSTEVEDAVAGLPQSVLETLHTETRYSWVVIGLGEDGRALGTSSETDFVIAKEPGS